MISAVQKTTETSGVAGWLDRLLVPTPRVVTFLLLLTVIVRLGFFVGVAHPEARAGEFVFQHDSDESDYHNMARHLAIDGVYKLSEDGPPTAKRPPGMALPMAALYGVLGPSPWLGFGWVLLCSLLCVPVIGALARECGIPPPGQVLAMLFMACLPTAIFTTGGLWSEPPSLLFTLLGLYGLRRARRTSDDRFVYLSALALGYAYLVRPSVLAVIVLVVIILAVDGLRRRRPLPVVGFAVLVALPIAAWGYRNQVVFGEFFTGNTESTAALWGANNPVTAGLALPAQASSGGYDLVAEARSGAYLGSWVPVSYVDPQAPDGLDELERHHWYRQQVRGFVAEHPVAFARLVALKLVRVLTAEPYAPSILGESPGKRRLKRLVTFGERWFLLLLGGWGLWRMVRRRNPALLELGIFLAGSAAVVVLAYVNARILLPVSALLILPAALGAQHLLGRLGLLEPHEDPAP